jgi:hypothetical protein
LDVTLVDLDAPMMAPSKAKMARTPNTETPIAPPPAAIPTPPIPISAPAIAQTIAPPIDQRISMGRVLLKLPTRATARRIDCFVLTR